MCGGIFGGGGGSSYTPPQVQKVNPTPTQVTPSNVDDGANKTTERKKQRQRAGFSSTQAAVDTLAAGAGKTTLG